MAFFLHGFRVLLQEVVDDIWVVLSDPVSFEEGLKKLNGTDIVKAVDEGVHFGYGIGWQRKISLQGGPMPFGTRHPAFVASSRMRLRSSVESPGLRAT